MNYGNEALVRREPHSLTIWKKQMTHVMVRDIEPAERTLLAAARGGNARAFEDLTRPWQRELHVHCYRMLGTLDDADDALQETLIRAWRHFDSFQARSTFRAWLYRIATNVCLTMLETRSRRNEVSMGSGEAGRDSEARQRGEPMHLQPYPDLLLDESVSTGNPSAIVERDEDVELAFVAAVQSLPPRQRATLLLRDAIGYPAAEVATMLETSVAGINSALQRARATLADARQGGMLSRAHTSPGNATEEALVDRLVTAWHAADVPSIVAILTEDALFSMPPEPQFFIGREAIAAFLAIGPANGRLDRFRMVPIRANRQPALASYYRPGDDGPFHAHGIIVLSFQGAAIASICRFGDASLFPRFGLPELVSE
jgi:RNA polymerase sigma-70 factor (TIGR02960 family)